MSRDAFRQKLLRVALPVLASSMIVSALSLQALGAWHVYRSLVDDDAAAPHSCAPAQLPALPVMDAPRIENPAWSRPPAAPEPSVDESAPLCDFGEVILIAASNDPRWSMAAVRTDGAARLHHSGDVVAGHTVQAIAWDSVSLTRGAERCRMQIGVKPRSDAARETSLRPAVAQSADALSKLGGLIQEVAPGEVVVDRAAIDLVSENFDQLTKGASLRRVDGGVALARLPRGGILEKLGLRRGDVLHTLNGHDVSDNRAMLEAYGRLPYADRITVSFSRQGKAMAVDVAIR